MKLLMVSIFVMFLSIPCDAAEDRANDHRPNQRIDINTASPDELMTLPGIDDYRAKMIDAYRYTYGAFRSVEGLRKVPDISDEIFEEIKDKVCVDTSGVKINIASGLTPPARRISRSSPSTGRSISGNAPRSSPIPYHLVLSQDFKEAKALVRKLYDLSQADGAGPAALNHLRRCEEALSAAEKNRPDSIPLLVESFPELIPYLAPNRKIKPAGNREIDESERILRRFSPNGISAGQVAFRNRLAGRGQGMPFVIMRKSSGRLSGCVLGGAGRDTVLLKQGSISVALADVEDMMTNYFQDDDRRSFEIGSLPVPEDFKEGPVEVHFPDGDTGRFKIGKGIAPPDIQEVNPANPVAGQDIQVSVLGAFASYLKIFPGTKSQAGIERTASLSFQIRSGEFVHDQTVIGEWQNGDADATLTIPPDFPGGPAYIRARVEDGPWGDTFPVMIADFPASQVTRDRPDRRTIYGYPGQAVPLEGVRLPRDASAAFFAVHGEEITPVEAVGSRQKVIRVPKKIQKKGIRIVQAARIGRVWTSSFDYWTILPSNRPIISNFRGRSYGYVNGQLTHLYVQDLAPGEIYLVSISPFETRRPFVPMQADDNGRIRFRYDRNSPLPEFLLHTDTLVLRIKAVVGKTEGPDTFSLIPIRQRPERY